MPFHGTHDSKRRAAPALALLLLFASGMAKKKRLTKAASPAPRPSKDKPAGKPTPVGDVRDAADTDSDAPLGEEAPDPNPGLDGFK